MASLSRTTYTLVTLAYWAFMLTDGALRMVVLFRFHELGYSPIQLSFLFLLYEFAGIITNLIGGWVGARFGLRKTLFLGLTLQILALSLLSLASDTWTPLVSVLFVMIVQGLAGIAKDLTKMSSKSSVKLLVPKTEANAESKLFFWVALLTGLKNTLKGIGFFLGGFLFSVLSYQNALLAMAAGLCTVLIASLIMVRGEFGKAKKKPKLTQLFSKSSAINRLSFARAALFASRDVWFVVGLPLFLRHQLDWSVSQIGAFMASWVIGYGFVQASAPKIANATQGLSSAVKASKIWGWLLVLICGIMPILFLTNIPYSYIIFIGLTLFGIIFAINSSVHSYLILAYTSEEDVSLDVGFYYMANAVGRFAGTLLSGVTFLVAGLQGCLIAATLLSLIAAITSLKFPSKN